MRNEDDKPASAILKGTEIKSIFGMRKAINQETSIVLHRKQIRVEIVPTSSAGTKITASSNFLVTVYKLID